MCRKKKKIETETIALKRGTNKLNNCVGKFMIYNIMNEIFFLASVPSPACNDIAVPKHSVSSAPLNNKYLSIKTLEIKFI